MSVRKNKSAASFDVLRSRVRRLFAAASLGRDPKQQVLALNETGLTGDALPINTLSGFIDFLAAAVPSGQVYLFGGVLRDLALYGRRGFSSDIDIVVEGGWASFAGYLDSIGAQRNKFGGYRLFAGNWPIDIWNAEHTWAIRSGFVRYEGIASLTKTTILNWDAILMNWRSHSFVCAPKYLEALSERAIEIVLEENPNPLGMAVRVFRHLSAKDARKIGPGVASYLERCTETLAFECLAESERASYGNNLIEPALYKFFEAARQSGESSIEMRFSKAAKILEARGEGLAWRQADLAIDR